MQFLEFQQIWGVTDIRQVKPYALFIYLCQAPAAPGTGGKCCETEAILAGSGRDGSGLGEACLPWGVRNTPGPEFHSYGSLRFTPKQRETATLT